MYKSATTVCDPETKKKKSALRKTSFICHKCTIVFNPSMLHINGVAYMLGKGTLWV